MHDVTRRSVQIGSLGFLSVLITCALIRNSDERENILSQLLVAEHNYQMVEGELRSVNFSVNVNN